jgi:hypothetical protein
MGTPNSRTETFKWSDAKTLAMQRRRVLMKFTSLYYKTVLGLLTGIQLFHYSHDELRHYSQYRFRVAFETRFKLKRPSVSCQHLKPRPRALTLGLIHTVATPSHPLNASTPYMYAACLSTHTVIICTSAHLPVQSPVSTSSNGEAHADPAPRRRRLPRISQVLAQDNMSADGPASILCGFRGRGWCAGVVGLA